ncbi:branched-chain amino acid ABC transporter permease [Aeromicrobium sp. CFBP 8757]|uniref:branched-chain amino acid ABC transporter permease n=1 Tax=Aeromicrobium sp. CFBP 8757 TaxID=2775288 RepID=UPI00177FAFD6|nr:branched-chain amino acid ABC transporter permease [Aeromicrobium sp. CFBP 8757]MBD8605492.1 branched-chain amino acid ABC transporter permease [Aeromicrobium sp. CFBP 8757]
MLQDLVNALTLGSIYTLFSLGLSLAWAGLGILNLAHGSIFMTGALTAWKLSQTAPQLPFVVVLLVAVVIGGALGLAMEFLVFRPVRKRATSEHQSALTMVIATVATAALLIAVAVQITGGQPRSVGRDLFTVSTYDLGSVRISNIQLIIIVTALVASAGVARFIQKSRHGRALRALAVDRDMAKMSGVSADFLSAGTVAVAGAAAGLAGLLLAVQVNAVEAHVGEPLLFKAFAILIIAGVGSIRATVIAAFALAVIETAVVAYWASDLRDVVVFAVIIAFLVVRPQGISSKGWQRA